MEQGSKAGNIDPTVWDRLMDAPNGDESAPLVFTMVGVIAAKLLEAGVDDRTIVRRTIGLTERLLVGIGVIEGSTDALLRRLSPEEFSTYDAAAHRALRSMFDEGVIHRVEHIDMIQTAGGLRYEATCSDSDGESSVRHWNPVDGSWSTNAADRVPQNGEQDRRCEMSDTSETLRATEVIVDVEIELRDGGWFERGHRGPCDMILAIEGDGRGQANELLQALKRYRANIRSVNPVRFVRRRPGTDEIEEVATVR